MCTVSLLGTCRHRYSYTIHMCNNLGMNIDCILALRSDHEPKGTTTTFYTYEQFSGIQSLGNGNAPCRHESSECQPYAVE